MAIGIVPSTMYQPRRASTFPRLTRPSRLRTHARAIRHRSARKYRRTAAIVPSWVTAVNAAPGSSQPRKAGTMRRWAVLEIGQNSVSPCTIPSTMASRTFMRRGRVEGPGVAPARRLWLAGRPVRWAHGLRRAGPGDHQPPVVALPGPAPRAPELRTAAAGRAGLLRRAHAALRPRPAARHARGLPALRADLHPPRPARTRGLHARARGQPLRHRLPRRPLPLARGLAGRPDPVPGRRAADDRRSRPPAGPADHAAGLPPGAHRRVGRHDARRDRPGDGVLAARRDGRPLRVDA